MKKRSITRSEKIVRASGAVELRLLICRKCRSVWPTVRDPSEGQARQDGEPCGARTIWEDYCSGYVHPYHESHRYAWEETESGDDARAAYGGAWCKVLGVPWGCTDVALVRKRYRELAKQLHPDVGGDHARMVKLNDAYRAALAELGSR